MTWQLIKQFDLIPDKWAITDPIDGIFFKVRMMSPDFEFRGKIAQAQLKDGVMQVFGQELLRFRQTEEIFCLEKPLVMPHRRIAIQAINADRINLEAWQCKIQLFSFISQAELSTAQLIKRLNRKFDVFASNQMVELEDIKASLIKLQKYVGFYFQK